MATTVADADVALHVDAVPFAKELRAKLEPIIRKIGKQVKVPLTADVDTTRAAAQIRRFKLREVSKRPVKLGLELPDISKRGKGLSGTLSGLQSGFSVLTRAAGQFSGALLRTFGVAVRGGPGAIAVFALLAKVVVTAIGVVITLGAVLVGVLAGIAVAAAIAGGALAVFGLAAIPTLSKIAKAVSGGNEEIAKLPKPLQAAAREVQKLKVAFGNFLQPLQGPIAGVIANFTRLARETLPLLGPVAAAMTVAVGGLADRLREAAQSETFKALLSTLETRGPAIFGSLTEAALQFGRGLASIITQLGPFAETISRKLASLGKRFANFINTDEGKEKIQGFIDFVLEELPGAFEGLKTTAAGVTDLLKSLASEDVQKDLENLGTVLEGLATGVDVLERLFSVLDKIYKLSPAGGLADIIGVLLGFKEPANLKEVNPIESEGFKGGKDVGPKGGDAAPVGGGSFGGGFGRQFDQIALKAQQLPGIVGRALSTLGTTLFTVFTSAFTFARTAVAAGITNVVTFFSGIPGRVISALSSLGTILFTIGSNAINSLRRGFSAALGFALLVVRSIPGKIKDAFTSIYDDMFSIGTTIVKQIARGIRSAIGSVIDAAEAIADEIPNPLRVGSPTKTGPMSHATTHPEAIGKRIAVQLAKGLGAGQGAVSKQLERTALSVPRTLAAAGSVTNTRSVTNNNTFSMPSVADPMQLFNAFARRLAVSGGL